MIKTKLPTDYRARLRKLFSGPLPDVYVDETDGARSRFELRDDGSTRVVFSKGGMMFPVVVHEMAHYYTWQAVGTEAFEAAPEAWLEAAAHYAEIVAGYRYPQFKDAVVRRAFLHTPADALLVLRNALVTERAFTRASEVCLNEVFHRFVGGDYAP